MSKLALVGLIASTMLSPVAPAGAWSLFGDPLDTAPWCVVYDIGAGVVHENCSMPSYQACNAAAYPARQDRLLPAERGLCELFRTALAAEAQAAPQVAVLNSNALSPHVSGRTET